MVRRKRKKLNETKRQSIIEQELKKIRLKMLPYALAKGIYTDQNVENKLKA